MNTGYGTPAEHVAAVRADRMADYVSTLRAIGWMTLFTILGGALVHENASRFVDVTFIR